MASFPILRPTAGLANAERWVVRSSRALAVLPAIVRAALSVVASLADSELATLRGAKALARTPASATHAVAEPAPGIGTFAGATA
jgi:hypothetical protein